MSQANKNTHILEHILLNRWLPQPPNVQVQYSKTTLSFPFRGLYHFLNSVTINQISRKEVMTVKLVGISDLFSLQFQFRLRRHRKLSIMCFTTKSLHHCHHFSSSLSFFLNKLNRDKNAFPCLIKTIQTVSYSYPLNRIRI